MESGAIRRRIYIHRGMWSMERNRLHMAVGAVWLLLMTAFLVLGVGRLWSFQTGIIERLLAFAKVPYRLLALPVADLSKGLPIFYKPGGTTFVVPVEYKALSSGIALLIIAFIVLAGFVFYRIQSVPLPLRVLALFMVVLAVSTILYSSFVSPVPPKAINRLSIDWQWSGALILFLISFIYLFSVFPVNGPLWIKFGWLFATLGYAVLWNAVRISVVLSTLYHLGSTPFLITHYLAGIYIDFIYVVAFYSLALAHLARHEVSEVGW